MNGELIVCTGQIVALRLFDVAYAIDLAKAEALWRSGSKVPSSRSRLQSTPAKALAFETPPVLLKLEPVDIALPGRLVRAGVSARVYDFGAISIALRFPVEGLPWSGFAQTTTEVNAALGPDATSAIWDELLSQLKQQLLPALLRPGNAHLQEDYLIGVVGRLSEPLSAQQLLARADVVPLLSGETRPLSEAARKDLTRQSHSYYEDDLVILTWDRALIYEPRGETDVLDVLEVANAQLLEMRYYDELLDDELPRMYDRVEEARRVSGLAAPRRYADLARRLHTVVAEVTELTERVDNALQVMEDVYLARVYTAALELFRVPKLSAAVDRKLAIIRDTYTALYEEASARRDVILEIAIVVLIVLELVLALLRH
jgi:hypothetical protein